MDGNVRGLMLVVTAAGSRSWILRVVTGGKRRDIGLGGFPDVSVEQAREKARTLRSVIKSGADPVAARDKSQAVIPNFADAAQACHDAKASGWTSRHAGAFLSTLKLHAYPRIGKLRVDSVDANDIVGVLNPMWTSKPAAARKIRQRIGIVLDYAAGKGWRRDGMPRDGVRPLLPTQKGGSNFAAIDYSDVPDFVSGVRDRPATSGRLALLFTVLTAARSGETRSALWSHIDLEAGLWHRPPELMKSFKAHTVTLSPAALAVLEKAKVLRTTLVDCLVFPGSQGCALSDMTMLKVVRDAGRTETVHGFRASFRTWAAEQMPVIPEPVAEAALAHVVPDAVERAYKRAKFLDMRRTLLNAWGDFCTGDVTQGTEDDG